MVDRGDAAWGEKGNQEDLGQNRDENQGCEQKNPVFCLHIIKSTLILRCCQGFAILKL